MRRDIQLILPILSQVRGPLGAGAALYKVLDMIKQFTITVLWFSSGNGATTPPLPSKDTYHFIPLSAKCILA
jgi:hypothetical protein